MVSIDARPRPRPARADTGRDGTRAGWLVVTGAVAAALGAAVAMAVLSAVTVLLWAAGPIASEGVSAVPFRGAASLWLMSQRAPLDSGTYDLVLPPLAVTALVVVLTAGLAGWAVRAASAYEPAPAAIVAAGVVLGHVGVAGVAGWLSARAGSGVDIRDAMQAALMFAPLSAVAGIAPQTWPWATAAARVGTEIRTVARAAGLGALALAAGGALALVAALAVHSGDVVELGKAVGGGISGGAGSILLCLAMAPNAILWVVSLAAGPGFGLGTDGGLSLTGDMHGGALPAMPLLAALPGAGPLPGYAWLLAAIPIGAGGVIGWFARPADGARRWSEELVTAAVAGVACGLGVGLLAGYSAGGAGGRLDDFGPNGVLVGAVLALELAAAATVVAAGRIGWEHFGRPPKRPAAGPPVIPAQTRKTTDPVAGAPSTGTPIEVVRATGVADLPPVDDRTKDPTGGPVVTEDDLTD